MTEPAFVLEVFDPVTESWDGLDSYEGEAILITWGLTRPARLLRDGEEWPVRFRLWQLVSAGTDRVLVLEAIPGLTLYAGPIT